MGACNLNVSDAWHLGRSDLWFYCDNKLTVLQGCYNRVVILHWYFADGLHHAYLPSILYSCLGAHECIDNITPDVNIKVFVPEVTKFIGWNLSGKASLFDKACLWYLLNNFLEICYMQNKCLVQIKLTSAQVNGITRSSRPWMTIIRVSEGSW